MSIFRRYFCICIMMTFILGAPVWVNQPWALPDSEVQRLKVSSPEFRAAEEEILSVWSSLSPETRKRLQASQLAWIKRYRDEEALRLIAQGYSYAIAYTIVTRKKTEELKKYLEVISYEKHVLTALEYQRLMSSSIEFKEADRELNRVWKQVLKQSNDEEKSTLTREQYHWATVTRDLVASDLLAQGHSFARAYTVSTKERITELKAKMNTARNIEVDDRRSNGFQENKKKEERKAKQTIENGKVGPGTPRLVIQGGHTGSVYNGVFSPDGRQILTTDGVGLILWDFDTGLELWRHHDGVVGSIGFTPNGKYIYYLSPVTKISRLTVLDFMTGQKVWEGVAPALDDRIAVSPDSKTFLTGSLEGWFYNVETGKELGLAFGMFKANTYVAYIDLINDRLAMTAGNDSSGIVDIWNVHTGQKLNSYKIHHGAISQGAVSDEGKLAVTCDENGEMKIWETSSGLILRTLKLNLKINPGNKPVLIFSNDGKWIAASNSNQETCFYGVNSGREIRLSAEKIVFSPNESIAYALTPNGSIRLIDLETSKIDEWIVKVAAGANSMAVSPNGRFLLFGLADCRAMAWDLVENRYAAQFKGVARAITAAAISKEGYNLLFGDGNGRLHQWDLERGIRVHRSNRNISGISAIDISPDGLWAACGFDDGRIKVWNISNGSDEADLVGHFGRVIALKFSRDSSSLVSSAMDSSVVFWRIGDMKEISIFRLPSGHLTEIRFMNLPGVLQGIKVDNDGYPISLVDVDMNLNQVVETRKLEGFKCHLSADGRLLIRNNFGAFERSFLAVEDTKTGKQIFAPELFFGFCTSFSFSPNSQIATIGHYSGCIFSLDLKSLKFTKSFRGHTDEISSTNLIMHNSRLVSTSHDGTVRIWDFQTGKELVKIIELADGTWLVVDGYGRFDTNNLEKIQGVHWIMPDDPLTPLPLELFMRDYYEPDLLGKVLYGMKLPSVKPLLEVNRALPNVEFLSVKPDRNQQDTVQLSLKVTGGRKSFLRHGLRVKDETGAYDLRVFRDGRLVTYAPAEDGEIPIDAEKGFAIGKIDGIKIPSGEEEVEFSAFAFNVDGVKSKTTTMRYRPERVLPLAKGKVYLVTIGVNACEIPEYDLTFAANDARVMQETLISVFKERKENFSEVVSVPLISDYQVIMGSRELIGNLATKDLIMTVFDLLAGYDVDPAIKSKIPNNNKLVRATPEDVMIITISSHGYIDKKGSFYLIPYNIGTDKAEFLRKSISSDELANALRDIDAGNMVMIIDACHSAASVKQHGFKPGPMGCRGFGQLAYYKGMMILAATQTEDLAIEDEKIRHGFLTYTLTKEGLQKNKADFSPHDNSITLSEWLGFGVDRVPQLHDLIDSGNFMNESDTGQSRVIINKSNQVEDSRRDKKRLQQPNLFNFNKNDHELILKQIEK